VAVSYFSGLKASNSFFGNLFEGFYISLDPSFAAAIFSGFASSSASSASCGACEVCRTARISEWRSEPEVGVFPLILCDSVPVLPQSRRIFGEVLARSSFADMHQMGFSITSVNDEEYVASLLQSRILLPSL
jgi:hypothetical protein